MYDWHNAENAATPHCVVFQIVDGEPGDAVASFYFDVTGFDPERAACALADRLNEEANDASD